MIKKKIPPLSLILMLILSYNMISLGSASPAGTVHVPTVKFSSDPEEPNYKAVGDNFTIDITAQNFVEPGVYAYQFQLHYDNTLLKGLSVELPEGHWLTPELDPGNLFITTLSVEQEAGYIDVAITLLGEEPGKTGNGTLVTVTFEILKGPPPAGEVFCDLELTNVIFADPDIKDIEVVLEHGYYEYAAPKPPLPYLQVDPEFVSAEEVGDEVIVNITIQELMADWRAVGFEWKLSFNTTILETKGEWVTEGDFLKQFGETYFYALQEADYVISFSLQLGPEGEFPPPEFPQGSGTLATIKFNATYKPTFVDMVASCKLDLYDILIADVNATKIETDPEVDGFYQIAVAPPTLAVNRTFRIHR